MEWIFLLYNVFIMFSVEQVISLPVGVCKEYQSIEHSNAIKTALVTFCCNYYHKRNGVCVACLIGYKSKGDNCTPCLDGHYGKKCAEICSCDTTERCNHVSGCIAIDDKTETNDKTTKSDGQSNGQDADKTETNDKTTKSDGQSIGQDAAITLREIILFVVITSFGILIVGGLVYMCWKRILITQHQHNEMIADNSRNKRQIQLTEEGSESVYDVIDESALSKSLEPFIFRTQNSYLDVTYSPNTQMNVKDNLGIICLTRISSQSQPVQNTSLRRQRGSLEGSIFSCQGALKSAYSDGYLRPRSFEHHNGINKMMENQETFFSNKDKMARKEYDGHIYDEPAYDGIGRPANYDRLNFFKDTSNSRNEIVMVQHPIETEQPGKNIRHQKYTTCSPKRKTI